MMVIVIKTLLTKCKKNNCNFCHFKYRDNYKQIILNKVIIYLFIQFNIYVFLLNIEII